MDKEVGLVEYIIDSNDTMNADWYMQMNGQHHWGTGKVFGVNNGQFAGEYEVTYFNSQTQPIALFNLSIQRVNHGFELVWRRNSEVKFVGVGRIKKDALIAAYTCC